LRPLKHISDAIQQVGVSRLHERLDPRQWPSELVQLVENFDKMLDRLEDSVKRISRFSSDIAHDLRTPIQTLRGESEIMLLSDRTIEEYQENLTSSLEEYDRLTHLIESLLFIERAENTDMELKQTTFDIKTKVDKIISFYEALIELKAITVVFNGTGQVNADPILFERAIINLISNAIKYTKNGGHLKFYVATKNDQTVSLSVNNDGPAIEPEDLEHLFDRFYRADSAKKVDHNGLGLGLSIAKSIMDLHGGNIQVQSNAITGTTFTLNFPPT
jgi:two-component system heavy metal sensor histidine kinase CusS